MSRSVLYCNGNASCCNAFINVSMHIHALRHVCMHTCMYVCLHFHICMITLIVDKLYIYIYIEIFMCVQVHVHTHGCRVLGMYFNKRCVLTTSSFNLLLALNPKP